MPRKRRVKQSSHEGFFPSANEGQNRSSAGRIRTLTQLENIFGSNRPNDNSTDEYTLEETRRLFLEVLRAEYERLIENGNLANREDLNYILFTSIDFCADRVNKGGNLNDWEFIKKFRGSGLSWKNLSNSLLWRLFCNRKSRSKEAAARVKEISVRFEVNLAIAFLEAHARARKVFSQDFAGVQGNLSAVEAKVLGESEDECKVAQLFLSSLPEEKVKIYVSHILSIVVLNRLVKDVENLASQSFLKETEADEFLENIQNELFETERGLSNYYRDKRRSLHSKNSFFLPAGEDNTTPVENVVDEYETEPTQEERISPAIVERKTNESTEANDLGDSPVQAGSLDIIDEEHLRASSQPEMTIEFEKGTGETKDHEIFDT